MHHEWKVYKLGNEPSFGGVPRCEIDVSDIIGNYDKIFWMFWIIIQRIQSFYCLDNRTNEILLPLVIDSIATNHDIIDIENESMNIFINTVFSNRMYSD